MFYLDIDILIKQLLPPNWRFARNFMANEVVVSDSGKTNYLKSVLMPLKDLLNDFKVFRLNSKSSINLTSEVVVLENHLLRLAGLSSGISIADDVAAGSFVVYIPLSVQGQEAVFVSFLQKIIPLGRNYNLIFY